MILVSDKGVSGAAKQPLVMAKNREQPTYYWTLDAEEILQANNSRR